MAQGGCNPIVSPFASLLTTMAKGGTPSPVAPFTDRRAIRVPIRMLLRLLLLLPLINVLRGAYQVLVDRHPPDWIDSAMGRLPPIPFIDPSPACDLARSLRLGASYCDETCRAVPSARNKGGFLVVRHMPEEPSRTLFLPPDTKCPWFATAGGGSTCTHARGSQGSAGDSPGGHVFMMMGWSELPLLRSCTERRRGEVLSAASAPIGPVESLPPVDRGFRDEMSFRIPARHHGGIHRSVPFEARFFG